jgi:hypothetical protein
MKKQKMVTALLYKMNICDSTIDMVHGASYEIDEIFVPKASFVVNEKGFAFYAKGPRNVEMAKILDSYPTQTTKVTEIKISQKLVSGIRKYICITDRVKPQIDNFFKALKAEGSANEKTNI